MDFVLIGVHTPEFEFEKDPANVERALKQLGVTWPVVLDNEYQNWQAFANRYWPAKYLIDRRGKIVYTHFGEGSNEETEMAIQQAIANSQSDFQMTLPDKDVRHNHGKVCFIPTPELYCGYSRGQLANEEGYVMGKSAVYQRPQSFPEDMIALGGPFIAHHEYVESQSPESTLLLNFHATEVNVVLHPGSESTSVKIKLNGQAVPVNVQGTDITTDGVVEVTQPRLYNLVLSDDLIEGVLEIQAQAGNFQAYAFTFSGCPRE